MKNQEERDVEVVNGVGDRREQQETEGEREREKQAIKIVANKREKL